MCCAPAKSAMRPLRKCSAPAKSAMLAPLKCSVPVRSAMLALLKCSGPPRSAMLAPLKCYVPARSAMLAPLKCLVPARSAILASGKCSFRSAMHTLQEISLGIHPLYCIFFHAVLYSNSPLLLILFPNICFRQLFQCFSSFLTPVSHR
jgi:hypothetical protein